jgi:hypothetical protein
MAVAGWPRTVLNETRTETVSRARRPVEDGLPARRIDLGQRQHERPDDEGALA